MGFEQLAFSFAHFGLAYLFTFTACQMASASLASQPSARAAVLRLSPSCGAIGQQPSRRRCICKCDLTGYEMEICIRDVDHLKERLIAEWRRFDQNIAVNQWRERLCGCVRENGGHFQRQI